MKEILTVDVGHLMSEEDDANFISLSSFESLCKKYTSSFDQVIETLRNKTSPITRPFLVEPSLPTIKSIAEFLRRKYENVLILGIGGSTLGFRAMIQYLKGPFYNFGASPQGVPRVFVVDNVDPMITSPLGNLLDFRKTALVYISKSGSTPEPAANFLHFYKKYRDAGGAPGDIVIICDPADNGINRIAKGLGARLLHIPVDLPGRYSVLSSAGLLPAEIIGIESQDLLKGANRMHEAILQTSANQNPICILGTCLSELERKGKSIHVLFTYSNLLSDFGLWFAQLWAESLGKKHAISGRVIHAGTTPLPALGATDQHSLLQLFREGPNDKVFGFVTVKRFPSDVMLTDEFPSEVEYSYFAGHTLTDQLKMEQIATEMSLVRAKRACYQLILPHLSAFTLGGLFYFMETLVVFMATLWQVNPFDQPGVEEGKRITYSLMGRQDYAMMRTDDESELASFNRQRRLFQL